MFDGFVVELFSISAILLLCREGKEAWQQLCALQHASETYSRSDVRKSGEC